MNDTIFHLLVFPWIPYKDLPIMVNRKCSEYIGRKKANCSITSLTMLAELYVHTGGPCYRYCICRFFTANDKIVAYRDYNK